MAAMPLCPFGPHDRLTPVETRNNEHHVQLLSVPSRDRLDVLRDGIGEGEGRLGVYGVPERLQVAPQELAITVSTEEGCDVAQGAVQINKGGDLVLIVFHIVV